MNEVPLYVRALNLLSLAVSIPAPLPKGSKGKSGARRGKAEVGGAAGREANAEGVKAPKKNTPKSENQNPKSEFRKAEPEP